MKAKQPNILLIMTDQHRHDVLGCSGHPVVKTPHLDALASESIRYESAYCPAPSCGPSRAALMTGMYPAKNGAVSNWISPRSGVRLLTDRLFRCGYRNGLVGKLHLSPAGKRHGFDWERLCDCPHSVYATEEVIYNDYLDWLADRRPDRTREEWEKTAGASERLGIQDVDFWLGWSWIDDANHYHTWTGDRALEFLKDTNRDQPFFLKVSFFGPHHPYSSSEPWDSMYPPDPSLLPETFTVPKDSPIFNAFRAKQRAHRGAWPREKWLAMIARYYGQVSQIDRQVGRILESLRQQGLWDDTLVIFTSDHGDHLGDFSLLGKGDFYESSGRVPLLIKPPGPPSRGSLCPLPVGTIDLFGLILDTAGDRQWKDDEGLDAQPWPHSFGEDTPQVKRPVFGWHGKSKDSVVSMVRDGDWKLMRLDSPGSHPLYELYNLNCFPLDAHDRAGEPGCEEILTKLQATLNNWIQQQNACLPAEFRSFEDGTGFAPDTVVRPGTSST